MKLEADLKIRASLIIVIGPSGEQSGSNRASNFKIGRARSARPI